MTANRALIVLNGDYYDYSQIPGLRDRCNTVIACDGASEHLKAVNIMPNVVIGDFDSSIYPGPQVNSTRYIKFPRDKDFTDSELAFDYAKAAGFKDVIVAGLNGSRNDHALVNTFLSAKPKYKAMHIEYWDHDQVIYVAKQVTVISGDIGDTISFLPIFGPVRINQCTGLRYDLKKYKLSMYGNQGISNVLTSSKAQIGIAKGKLLVVHQLRGSDN